MKITANIAPVPLARTQINTYNRGRFLAKRSQDFKDSLSWIARAAMAGRESFNCPLRLSIHFFKNYKKLADMSEQNTGDIDNFVKAVLDACNQIVWTDDRQIVEVHAFKHSSNKPRVEFDFEPAELNNFNAGADSVAFLLKSIASSAGIPVESLLAEVTDILKGR